MRYVILEQKGFEMLLNAANLPKSISGGQNEQAAIKEFAETILKYCREE